MKEGMNINDILDMPFSFMVDLLEEKQETSKTTDLFSAFGG